MQVGLEISSAAGGGHGGILRYIKGLSGALAQMPELDLSFWYRLSRLRQRADWHRIQGIPTQLYQGGWWPPRIHEHLIHGLDGTLPCREQVPMVATVHDLMLLRPEFARFAERSFREAKRARYQDMLKRAGRIIAVSECTRRDLVELLGANANRITVIPHGVDSRFKPLDKELVLKTVRRYGLEPGYLLYVGVIGERKNTRRLVQAFEAAPETNGRKLVLAGRVHRSGKAALEQARALGAGSKVVTTGPIADDDLPALYNGAGALTFPTLYEGFGLPVLEAMACGTPVLCADRGGATEVASSHAITVNPDDVEAIADGIPRALSMGQAQREAARTWAAEYTWAHAAERTITVYRDLLESESS